MAAATVARGGQGSDAASGSRNPAYRIAIIAVLAFVLLVAGGASRYDEPQQLAVRLAAIAAIAASLWRLETGPLGANRRMLVALAAVYAVVLVQLVPLPPGVWAQLPGRSVYAEIAEAAGAVGWRPVSLTPDLTLNALFALLPATAAGLAVLYLDGAERRRVWGWLVAGGLFSATLALVQLGAGGDAFRLFRETSMDSAVGVFANRNHQASFLACALPLIGAFAGLRLRDGGDRRSAIFAAVAAASLLLLAIVATRSRSGLVLAALGTLGAAWCFRATGAVLAERGSRARLIAMAAIAAALATVVFAAVRSGAAERVLLTDPAAESRAAMIEPLFRTAEAFFPVGAGFGSFDSVYRRFEPDALLSTIYMNQAHNEPMQLAIEGGVPALILLGLFLVWWVRTAFQIGTADVAPKRRAIGLASILITAILMAASLVDYPLRTPLLSAVFVVACVEMLRTSALRRRPDALGTGS